MIARQQETMQKTTTAESQKDPTTAAGLNEQQKQLRLEAESLSQTLSQPIGGPQPSGESHQQPDAGSSAKPSPAPSPSPQGSGAKPSGDSQSTPPARPSPPGRPSLPGEGAKPQVQTPQSA